MAVAVGSLSPQCSSRRAMAAVSMQPLLSTSCWVAAVGEHTPGPGTLFAYPNRCRDDATIEQGASMRLQVLGCGDAFGSGGRFNTCFQVSSDQTSFLLDCGASSLIAMRRFGVDPNSIQTILTSHLHGDHFGGLPFLLLDAHFVSYRRDPLTIAGPPTLTARLHVLREIMFPGSADTALRFP